MLYILGRFVEKKEVLKQSLPAVLMFNGSESVNQECGSDLLKRTLLAVATPGALPLTSLDPCTSQPRIYAMKALRSRRCSLQSYE